MPFGFTIPTAPSPSFSLNDVTNATGLKLSGDSSLMDTIKGGSDKCKSPVQQAADYFKLDKDSPARVASENKEEKTAATSSEPDDIAIMQRTALTEGYYKHPVAPDQSANTPADYYRNGNDTLLPRLLGDSDNETPASIRMIGKRTENSVTKDVDLIPPYSKFFLESVQESSTERSQIVETFGDFYVFFFGERPPIYTFSGTLLNANDVNWAEDFMFFYENFLRGTKCVEANARLLMTYGYRQIEGFLLGMSTVTQAANEKGVGVQFQVLVIDRRIMKLSQDFGLLAGASGFNIDKAFLKVLQKGLSVPDVSEAVNETKAVVAATKPSVKTSQPQAGDEKKPGGTQTLLQKAIAFGEKVAPGPTGTLKAASGKVGGF